MFVTPTEIVQEIFDLANQICEPYSELSDVERKKACALLDRFKRIEGEIGQLPYRNVMIPLLLSKNGQHDEALRITEENYSASPGWDTAIACANSARRSGNLNRAIEMFEKGFEHDPDDIACWLEIGDIRLEQRNYQEALEAYNRALLKNDIHQWALPSSFYCKHMMGIEGAWLQSLREVASQEGCTCGMQGCLTKVFGGYGSEDGIARAKHLLSKLDTVM
jgi:tetratricopeptide (TPR) repeat protein